MISGNGLDISEIEKDFKISIDLSHHLVERLEEVIERI